MKFVISDECKFIPSHACNDTRYLYSCRDELVKVVDSIDGVGIYYNAAPYYAGICNHHAYILMEKRNGDCDMIQVNKRTFEVLNEISIES